jgi:hypothetical protein
VLSSIALKGEALTYTFLTTWYIEASPEEVLSVLSDECRLPQWWPSAFLWVQRRVFGEETGIGRTADVLARGFLPYTLRWRVSVTEVSAAKDGFAIRVRGDLNGIGRWTAEAEGSGTALSFFWSVQVGHRYLKTFETLLRPLFRANHRWCMRQGERSIRLEVRRRRGESGVPDPPLPITMNTLWRRFTNAKFPST